MNKTFKSIEFNETGNGGPGGQSQFLNIKDKKVNIHYDRLKSINNDFWFGISKSIIKEADFFIFICNEIDIFYIIPKSDMRQLLEDAKENTSDPSKLTFHIKSDKHLIRITKYIEEDIFRYFKRINYIKGKKNSNEESW